MAFNLNSLALDETTELHLRHPVTDEHLYEDGDESKPVKIVLYGTSSKQYRTALHAMQNKRLKASKGKAFTAELLEDESVDLLVKCSVKGINLEHNGAPLNNAEAFRNLYNDASLNWIKAQVDATITDAASFLSPQVSD